MRDALAEELTAVVLKHLPIPPEAVTLIFTEVPKADWYVAGKPS